MIRQESISTHSGVVVLACLTPRGLTSLQTKDRALADRANLFVSRGLEHEYWRQQIAISFKRHGFDVSRESPVNGAIDLLVVRDGVRMAVEIETGKSDAPANVRKALPHNFSRILVAATSASARTTVHRQLDRAGLIKDSRVHIMLAHELAQHPKPL